MAADAAKPIKRVVEEPKRRAKAAILFDCAPQCRHLSVIVKKYLIAAALIVCGPQPILAQAEVFYLVVDNT